MFTLKHELWKRKIAIVILNEIKYKYILCDD